MQIYRSKLGEIQLFPLFPSTIIKISREGIKSVPFATIIPARSDICYCVEVYGGVWGVL
jgi:hypothetical protein